MLLVVGDDNLQANHVRALEREFSVETVSSPEAARERCGHERYEATIVDRPLCDPEVEWLVWDLRRCRIGPVRVPVVAVHAGSTPSVEVDESVRTPVDGNELATAVRRAVRLVEYEDAVGRLFDVCRRRIGRRPRELEPARARADECLRALDACEDRLPFERLVDV